MEWGLVAPALTITLLGFFALFGVYLILDFLSELIDIYILYPIILSLAYIYFSRY